MLHPRTVQIHCTIAKEICATYKSTGINPGLTIVLIHSKHTTCLSIRGVPRLKIPRKGKAKNVYLRQLFDPFLGKTKYCFKVLALFQKPFWGTPLLSILFWFVRPKKSELGSTFRDVQVVVEAMRFLRNCKSYASLQQTNEMDSVELVSLVRLLNRPSTILRVTSSSS